MKKENIQVVSLVIGVILMSLGASNYFKSIFASIILVIIGAVCLFKALE